MLVPEIRFVGNHVFCFECNFATLIRKIYRPGLALIGGPETRPKIFKGWPLKDAPF